MKKLDDFCFVFEHISHISQISHTSYTLRAISANAKVWCAVLGAMRQNTIEFFYDSIEYIM